MVRAMNAAAGPHAPTQVPAAANPEGDGIVVGTGPVWVDAYIDFLCPFCRQFEEQSGPTLNRLVDDDVIALIYHPLAFLEGLSTDHYSSRAASASACASDGGRFSEFKDTLFANQPEEDGPGLSDDELVALGMAVGLNEESFGTCVAAHGYLPWVAYLTSRAVERGVSGTPSVYVNGTAVAADTDAIVAAVDAAG
jgi:protein-disulfide isomerase